MTGARAAGGGGRRDPAGTRPGRTGWTGAITAAVVVTLARPGAWALALAGFLARGGIVLVAWPILVLPTPTGLQNLLGGPVSTLVFGAPSTQLAWLLAGGVLLALVVVLAGTWLAAWTERAGIEQALAAGVDEGLTAQAPDLAGAPGPWRIAAIRILGLAPLAIALLAGWQPVYDAAYHELTLPRDLATPLPVRVLVDVPGTAAAIALAWLAGDAAASVGVRRLILERRRVPVAWVLGWIDLLTRPVRVGLTALFGILLLGLMVLPSLAIAGFGWTRVRDVVLVGRDPVVIVIVIVVWVAMWLGSLVLLGVAAAIRNATWTFNLAPRG